MMPALTLPAGKNNPISMQHVEAVRKELVEITVMMGTCPAIVFADDPAGTNRTPDALWNMPEFRKIVMTWESDCGRYRGASLKLEHCLKLLATVADGIAFSRWDWDGTPIFSLTKEQIKELATA